MIIRSRRIEWILGWCCLWGGVNKCTRRLEGFMQEWRSGNLVDSSLRRSLRIIRFSFSCWVVRSPKFWYWYTWIILWSDQVNPSTSSENPNPISLKDPSCPCNQGSAFSFLSKRHIGSIGSSKTQNSSVIDLWITVDLAAGSTCCLDSSTLRMKSRLCSPNQFISCWLEKWVAFDVSPSCFVVRSFHWSAVVVWIWSWYSSFCSAYFALPSESLSLSPQPTSLLES